MTKDTKSLPMSAQPYGLIATFTTTAEAMHAAEQVRDAGYKFWDVISPFPIHGMDRAMGIRRSKVPKNVKISTIDGL